jgi:hypothetical protein
VIRLCPRCGKPGRRALDWCDDCGALLPLLAPTDVVPVLKLFAWCCAVVAVIFALLALNGCGPAFTAEELSTAGAGGHSQTLPQAGAGGREVSNGQAGQGGEETPNAGRAGSAGGSVAAGGADGLAGAESSSPAGSAGASAPSCLSAWRGSSCDTCSSSPAVSGRTCADVLDCDVMRGCSAASCPAECNYDGATSDAAVREAARVAACRCGAS